MPKTTTLHPIRKRPLRLRPEINRLKEQRSRWLASLAAEAPFLEMFNHIPGICFFAKDRSGRTMFASRGILERYQMRAETEMLGLTDFDINPSPMAEAYVSDDEQLLEGAVKRVERIELWFDHLGLPDWFLVTKLPLLDKRGRPQGVMGILRRAGEKELNLPLFQTVSKAVAVIRQDYAKPLIIAEIAAACGESLRQLQRRFNSAFGITAQEFLIRTRVLAAARLLEESNLTVSEIATLTGFVDASSFAEQFKSRCRMTPTDYRNSRISNE
jgi:AraC-like DNA-binding protein